MLLSKRSTSWAAVVRQRTGAVRSSAGRRTWHQSHRRGYASTGHQVTEKAKSDLPWLAGAIAVTVPSCWYLLQEGPAKPHGHEPGNDHMEHPDHPEHEDGAHKEASEDGDGSDEEPEGAAKAKAGTDDDDKGKEETGKADDGQSDASNESDSKKDDEKDTPGELGEGKPKNEKHEKDGGGDAKGVRGTSPKKDDAPGTTREHIPDAKGYNKKRINSDYGTPAGKAESSEQEPDKGDKASSSKPAGGEGTISGKQEGLSNTDTKHSTKIDDREDSPMKAEGPETSKAKGTIDPQRPQK